MGKLLLRIVPVLVLGAACATTAARTRELEARLATAQTDVERGQIHYEMSCQRCHALYMPRSYTASEWKFYVRKYGRRARLSEAERNAVYTYLATEAAGG
jgi:cytochrome c5